MYIYIYICTQAYAYAPMNYRRPRGCCRTPSSSWRGAPGVI